jgi:hypothetical protein
MFAGSVFHGSIDAFWQVTPAAFARAQSGATLPPSPNQAKPFPAALRYTAPRPPRRFVTPSTYWSATSDGTPNGSVLSEPKLWLKIHASCDPGPPAPLPPPSDATKFASDWFEPEMTS